MTNKWTERRDNVSMKSVELNGIKTLGGKNENKTMTNS